MPVSKRKTTPRPGRPAWVPPAPTLVETLASRGLTEKQISHALGICQDTFIQKKKEYSEFSEAILRGRAKGIQVIANALFERAKNGNVPAIIFFLKSRANWREAEYQETEAAPVDARDLREKILLRLANVNPTPRGKQ